MEPEGGPLASRQGEMGGQSRQREGMAEEVASRFGIQYNGWQKPAEANDL